jgi:hypothetical protein
MDVHYIFPSNNLKVQTNYGGPKTTIERPLKVHTSNVF